MRQIMRATTEAEIVGAEKAADAWLAAHPDDRRQVTVRSACERLGMGREAFEGAEVISFPGVWRPDDQPAPE